MIVRSKAKLTSKNQLTLPVRVREALGVKAGDELCFEIRDTEVGVRPVRGENPFRRYTGRYRVGNGQTPAQTDAFIRGLRGRDE